MSILSQDFSALNVAIIAHVDHGKTTLLDNMLKQSGVFRSNQQVEERVMDRNALEKKHGITILSKVTKVHWNDRQINIIDTPGHADFGGEVERVLSMADGVILLVDAAEGPMPQTKFVISKALRCNLRAVVVINKVDRPDQRVHEVEEEIYDMFLNLDAADDQLDFHILYASGRDGWCIKTLKDERKDLSPLFSTILSYFKPSVYDNDAPFAMLVSMMEPDRFLGKLLIGKIHQGVMRVGDQVEVLNRNSTVVERGRLNKILAFSGIGRVPVEEAFAGDIVSIAGLEKASVADSIVHPDVQEALVSLPIDPPTMAITISANDSPLAGRDGAKLTAAMIGERLKAEAEVNVAIRVTPSERGDAYEVAGRGELQLGILIEMMRQEGFELSVSRPRVLFKTIDGVRMEPIEEVIIDVDEEFSGVVMETISLRKGEMQDMRPSGHGRVRLGFLVPSRGLIGYHGEFLTDSRGTGIMNRVFHGYGEYRGAIAGRRNGVLISTESGEAVAYAIFNLQDRGIMFIKPQDEVYVGMIVGQNSRDNDLEINVMKGKQLTNIRAAGADEAVRLNVPKIMTLEEMIAYIEDDELVEVTPTALRLRKAYLDPNERKRASRANKD